jgi:hypothetical protein
VHPPLTTQSRAPLTVPQVMQMQLDTVIVNDRAAAEA